MNTNTEDGNHQASLPPSHVYCLPQHMTNLNLNGNESSSNIFYNPYMRLEDELKVGDKFHTKEDWVCAIKKFHMENSVDYTVDHTNARRYVILCRNVFCMFRLAPSYRKISVSWEISYIHLSHNWTATIIAQDHHKLNSEIICQDMLSFVSKEPLVKVSILIFHIATRYNYNPSYKKVWIARTNVVEWVYEN